MSTEVVKVQRPLADNGEPMWLIYDAERERIEHRPEHMISQEIKNLFDGRAKVYLLASWTGNGWVLPQEQVGESW